MNKEEILELINQQIKIALKKFKHELEQDTKIKKVPTGEEDKIIKSVGLQQFINEKNPRKVAVKEMPVIAYFFREIDKRKLDEVNEEIMRVAYKKITRTRPKRIKQAFADSPYFDKVPKKKGFYKLNDDGEYFVEIVLEKNKKKKYG